MAKGITGLYYDFYRKHLTKASTRNRVAPLQLIGRNEDYLVREFASFVHAQTDGSRACITNSGRPGQSKIDLAVVRTGEDGDHVAECFVEAKYLRNRHRMDMRDFGANDEIVPSLKELRRQLSFDPDSTHGFQEVKLRARTTKIYGLIFASYTRPLGSDDRKSEWYELVLSKAAEQSLWYHDLKGPYFRPVFEDVKIHSLGIEWCVSLRCGLWRLATK